jgi:predicted kinase
MDKKEWKAIDDLRIKVQQISEQQNMKKKLANVKYVAVEFAYKRFKNGEDAVNDAINHGYEVMETYKTESGIVVVLGRYRFGAV